MLQFSSKFSILLVKALLVKENLSKSIKLKFRKLIEQKALIFHFLGHWESIHKSFLKQNLAMINLNNFAIQTYRE